MRIVVFLNSLYTGGAEFSTLSLYEWLMKKGYEVKLVCNKKASPSYDPAQFGFTEVEYLHGSSFLQRVKSLNKIIQEYKPHLVHSVLFEANILSRISRVMLRNFGHLESMVNEMYSAVRLADPNVTRLKLESYRLLDRVTQQFGVDHFHANGVSVARHYREKLGIDQSRITIIPRGRKENSFAGVVENRSKVRQELQTGDRIMIVQVARHEYQKGQDMLLDAIQKLGELKEKMQVVLVGREGNFTSVIRDKIKTNGLETCVAVAGHRNDVGAILAAADVFVFPSRFEGLPGALIEAEAAGLPIICSDIPNNHEVVQEGVNALFFPLNDTGTLAGCIRKLVNEPELRSEMGKQSLTIFQQHFSLEDVHQKMKAMMEHLISTAS